MVSAHREITHLDTFEQFNALKAEWDALAAPQFPTIFLTHDWLSQWWQAYRADNQLWLLAAREQGELVGIVPLMLRRGSNGFRRLMFMGAGKVTPNHLRHHHSASKPRGGVAGVVVVLASDYLCWKVARQPPVRLHQSDESQSS